MTIPPLPAKSQRDWDDEMANVVNALDAATQSANANANAALSDAAYAKNRADEVHTAVIGTADAATAGFVNDDNSASTASIRSRVATDIPDPASDIGGALSSVIAAEVTPVETDVEVLRGQQSIPLLGRFSSPISEVAVTRTSATAYLLERNLGAQTWERWRFAIEAGVPGGTTARKLNSARIEIPMLDVDDDPSASVIYTGTGWANGFSNAGAYGGDYSRSSVVGDKVTWTTPTSQSKVGIHVITLAQGGIAKVTINGSTTRATCLSTAQQLVDAGTAPNTILAANGGPFQPTDRVLDTYSATTIWDVPVVLADDLPHGVHTVVVEMTTAKRTAATDSRVYYGGWMHAAPTTTIATAGASWRMLRSITPLNTDGTDPAGGGFEYAITTKPTGTTTATMVGTTHGYEDEVSVTFVMDGTTLALTDGQRVVGEQLTVTKVSNLRHPEYGGGTTPQARVTTIYTYTRAGLRVAPTIEWLVANTVTTTYLCMFTTNGLTFKKARVDADSTVYTLTADDNSYASQSRGQSTWLWEDGGRAAVILGIVDPDKVMNGWRDGDGIDDPANGTRFLALQDRNAAATWGHKIYPGRVGIGTSVTVANGEVWDAGAGVVYATQWFPTSPAAVLSVA